jgi:hypothetical protein
LRISASASFEALKWNGRIALSSAAAPPEVLPEVAGDGLCAKEDEVKPSAAMTMGSVFFITTFLVEVKEGSSGNPVTLSGRTAKLVLRIYI